MTNIKFLLIGTSLSLIPSLTFAQCVATQDCATLGYTETSCNGGKGVKCPFGNKWACLTSEEEIEQQFCDKYGFKYTCSGTGYSKGVGTACNGKYTSCTCASKYNWSGSACKSCGSSYKYTCTGTNQTSGVGTACGGYYTQCNCASPYTWSNGTCKCDSSYAYACTGTGYSGGVGTACGGKYAACKCASGYEWNSSSCQKQTQNCVGYELYSCNGTVVGIKANDMDFYVALKDLGYMNWTDANNQCQNYTFCGNIKGTLPTKEQLLSIYNNKSQINSLLSTNGGTKITERSYWSSSYGGEYYLSLDMSNGEYGYPFDNLTKLLIIKGQGANTVRFSAPISLPLTDGPTASVAAPFCCRLWNFILDKL